MEEGWGAAAVAGLAVAIIGALGTWALKLWDKSIEAKKIQGEARLKEMELQHKLTKQDTEDVRRQSKLLLEEKDAVIAEQQDQLEEQRQLLHKERDAAQTVKNEMYEMRIKVELCDKDRMYLRKMCLALYDAIKSAGINVALPELFDSAVRQAPPIPPTGGSK